jgi:hypothetical protein
MPAPRPRSGGQVSLVIAYSPTPAANPRFTRDSPLSQGCPRSSHGELSRNGDQFYPAPVARREMRIKVVRAERVILARCLLNRGGAWADSFCGQFLECRFELAPPRGWIDPDILAGDLPQSPQAF